jgi:hypothetical protein
VGTNDNVDGYNKNNDLRVTLCVSRLIRSVYVSI